MKQRLPPLTALRAFEAAARHMSFKAAAVELGVTPTAVSHQIRELEAACGAVLFRRQPRPLALTEAGDRLFPVLRAGFDSIAAVVSGLGEAAARRPLRVTTTNAFAHRWLVPRLPLWRAQHPEQTLEVIGTDALIDLRAGDADVAIRYARTAPAGLVSCEILRDTFWPMCSPALLPPRSTQLSPAALLRLPLIHMQWQAWEPAAPTWRRWVEAARRAEPSLSDPGESEGLHIREELHAIEAMIGGQGVGICSDLLVARELESGALVKASALWLPGFGFHVAHTQDHPRRTLVDQFSAWVRATAQA